MLVDLVGLFEQGVLNDLPLRVWDASRAVDALRFMSQGRHVGKNVLKVGRPSFEEGTVLLTGGTGGLGRLLAKHLVVAYSARRLLLVSRGGLGAPGAEKLARELRDLGAEVSIAACDVAE